MIKTTAKFESNQILIRGKINEYFLLPKLPQSLTSTKPLPTFSRLIPVNNQLKTATEKDPKLMARVVARNELRREDDGEIQTIRYSREKAVRRVN